MKDRLGPVTGKALLMNECKHEVCVCQRKEGLFEGCRRKEVPRRKAWVRKEATNEASCTRVAGVQAMSHPSSSKQHLHMKRLGSRNLPCPIHTGCPSAKPHRLLQHTKWDGKPCEARCGRDSSTHHWAVIDGQRLFAARSKAGGVPYARAAVVAAVGIGCAW